MVALSITARGGDSVQPDIAEHMRHEAEVLEDFRKRDVADAEPAGIGAERRHYHALAIGGKTSPFHRTAAGGDAGLGMQMSGDFADSTGRLMTKHDGAHCDFACYLAAEIIGQ